MALAIGFGMRVMSLPSAGQSPHSTMSSPQTMNAATALPKPIEPCALPAATSSAAPGVDHANEIGIFSQKLRMMQMSPTTRHSANRPEAACASVAPTARRPAMTRANDVAKPVIAATMPAEMG